MDVFSVPKIIFLFPALVIAGCAAMPSSTKAAAPLWVTDSAAAFPDDEWLCVVESAEDRKSAESAVLSALAQVFRVDLNSVTNANRQFAQALDTVKGERITVSSESRVFAQDMISSSTVSGLVGVRLDFWDSRNGTVYANARMNRKECVARYSAMIRENENIIRQLKKEAERNLETFDAVEFLNFALDVARVTDNLHGLLTVLDPSAISRRPDYGNAEAVKSLALNAEHSIVITLRVTGDTSGRIAGALSGYFTARGFRTDTSAANPYQLFADFALEDVDTGNSRNKFARYVLNCTIRNREGTDIFSYSENGREGHLTQNEARQRALRVAETSLGSTGFAEKFDAYLASLLQ
jgi:uncharacterized lipoprotein YajG